MAENMLVSIITPSFNQGEFIEQTLLSVFGQDYAPIEYIVMDGGSSDQTVGVLQEYSSRLAYWESTPDRGQAHAINKGLQRAHGEILGWLNSDDILLPGSVRKAVDTFARHPEVDVVYGRLERIDAAGRPVPTPLLPKDQVVFDPQHAIGECVVNQPGSFWRREIMEKAGLLDEDLRYVMDYEFWTRLLLAGGRFMRLSQAVAAFRLSQHSKTVGQTASMAREHLQLIDRLASQTHDFSRLGLSQAEIRRQARRGKALVSLYAGYGCVKERRWSEALGWFGKSLAADPGALFSRRWLDLLQARRRRLA